MTDIWSGGTEPVDPNAGAGHPAPPGGYVPPPPYAGGYEPPTAPSAPYAGQQQPRPFEPGWYDANGQWVPSAPVPAPSHRRRNIGIAVAVVLALALAGGLTFAFTGSSQPDRLAVPDSFDGYTRLTNDLANRMQSAMRSFVDNVGGSAGKQIFDSATIAVFAKNTGDQPAMISVLLPTSAARGGGSADDLTQQLIRAVPNPTEFPSGPHGGSTRCGTTQFGTASETMCAWSDPKSTGLVVSVNPPLQPGALAQVSRLLRDKVD